MNGSNPMLFNSVGSTEFNGTFPGKNAHNCILTQKNKIFQNQFGGKEKVPGDDAKKKRVGVEKNLFCS